MPIISSKIISTVLQVDGRTSITERHKDHSGVDHDMTYLAAVGLDTQAVLVARAANIGEAIDKRDAVEAEAANFVLPISRVAYVRRFTATERKAIYAQTKSNADVEDFWNMLLMADNGVHLNDPEVKRGLQMFEAGGLIGKGRAATIGAQ